MQGRVVSFGRAESQVPLGHADGGVEMSVRRVGLKLKIDVFPGGTSFSVFGSAIVISEALGGMRFFSGKIMRRKEGLCLSPEGPRR